MSTSFCMAYVHFITGSVHVCLINNNLHMEKSLSDVASHEHSQPFHIHAWMRGAYSYVVYGFVCGWREGGTQHEC